ncbi:MAG: hypothetical protein K8S98_08470 [Planctomycetes bacterium]|nr:hypothetical protein [Planctomycetota bacterium]
MNARGITLVFLFAVCAACASGGDGSRRSAVTTSKSVEGLQIELRELVDGKSYGHPPDADVPDRILELDTRSTLRMKFTTPPAEKALRASPEWQSIEETLRALDQMVNDYRALSAEASRLPANEFVGTEEFQAKIADFGKRQAALVNGLVATDEHDGLLTRKEFTAVVTDRAGPYVALAKRVGAELETLESRAKAFADAKDSVLVTVRARLEPEVGPEQWLQVPGYWEKQGEDPSANRGRSSSAELQKLKAEFAAAQQVAAMVKELKAHGASVLGDLRGLLDAARADVEKRWRELIQRRRELVRAILAREPGSLDGVQQSEQDLWRSLGELDARLGELSAKWSDLIAAAQNGTLIEQADKLIAAIESLGADLATVKTAASNVLAALPNAIASITDGETKTLLEQLSADLSVQWKTAVDGLLAKLSQTKAALGTLAPLFQKGNAVLAGLDALPSDPGSAIPHPPDDLPAIELDLRRQPITPGDRLRLDVSFYDAQEFQQAVVDGKSAKPLETIRYTNDAIKSGWIWSGDVIFAKQLSGPNDNFDSSAAVSYERHWRDRDDPNALCNRLDWGLGFHAAALNFDPNESAEFGVGVSGSLFGGLLRVGVGYDVSASDDQTYWFFGFGLVSALQQAKTLGEKAFSD